VVIEVDDAGGGGGGGGVGVGVGVGVGGVIVVFVVVSQISQSSGLKLSFRCKQCSRPRTCCW